MKLSKLLILICMGLVLSAVGGYLLFGGDGNEEGKIIQEMEQAAETADLTLEEIHYVETKGDKKEWELRAKSGQHFRKDDYTTLEDLTVTFYAEEGRIITLRGDKGSMKGRKEIEVWGNVVITSSDGYRVSTNSLRFDDEKQQISTAEPIMLEGKEGLQVKGVGAVVYLKKKTLSILRKVRVKQGNREATSHEATYYHRESKLVLQGEPVVREGDNWVTGKRIIYYIEEKRSVAEGEGEERVTVTIIPREEKQ